MALKIGVDIRDLRVARTGTRTYLEEICREFRAAEGKEYRFFFFDTFIPVYRGSNKLLKLAEHIRFFLWKQLILPAGVWLRGCDVLFCTDNIVPYLHLGFRTVPVLHDAFFFENPEHYNRHWLKYYTQMLLAGARRSPAIVVPSRYAARQVHRHTGIAMEKLEVVYEGLKHSLSAAEAGIPGRFGIEDRKYIFHAGVPDKRKNLPALVHAFARLKQDHPGLKLVLAGKALPKDNSDDSANIIAAVEQQGLQDEVILTGYLGNTELAALYAHALMYVFPSLNEGFGLPVLEAFSFGLPVLVANNTALPEIGGDAVLAFDPHSAEDMYSKMKQVADDHALRRELSERGRQRLAAFSWKHTAGELLALFSRVTR